MKRESFKFYAYGIIILVLLLLVTNKDGQQPTHQSVIHHQSNSGPNTIFVGILTMISKYERRSLIRNCYMRDIPAGMTVKFIFGKPKNEFEQNLLDMESSLYNDIIVMDIEENLDDGKTYSFVKWASLNLKYEMLFKTDDDVFLHLYNLISRINKLKKEVGSDFTGVYYGRHVKGTIFQAGMGYLLSWDLVDFIAKDEYARQHIVGQEDGLLASWLKHGNKIKHFISEDEDVNSFLCSFMILQILRVITREAGHIRLHQRLF
eukprot:NODE_1034_length_2521_cov_0.334847.p1 type:complete len:262 gc:universal NODE_1034_length_2521_cov_0.334847:1787-1002(-)